MALLQRKAGGICRHTDGPLIRGEGTSCGCVVPECDWCATPMSAFDCTCTGVTECGGGVLPDATKRLVWVSGGGGGVCHYNLAEGADQWTVFINFSIVTGLSVAPSWSSGG